MPKSGKKGGRKKQKRSKLFGTVSIKETYRKFLKYYDRLSAHVEKLALPSIRRSLRESIDNESILVKFIFRQPEPEFNDGLPISLVPLIDTVRHERYIHIRFIYVWNIKLAHEDLVAVAGLLEKKIYLLKHIELVECLPEPYSLQRLCLGINSCSTMTTLVLDYNEFGDVGCHSVCAGLRGNCTLLSLSLCFCNLGVPSGEYLSILLSTTAVRELYLDGNDLQSEGTIQLLRFCVEQALLESQEREIEAQQKAEEEQQTAIELEAQKKKSFVMDEKMVDSQGKMTDESKPEEKKKKKRRRKKKEKPKPPPPPVGPWIYKLHLADNGIDNMSRPEKSVLFTCLGSIAQLIMHSKCLQEIDLEDNFIGELGGEHLVDALQVRKEAGLPDVKLRTTHRIAAETLATIIKLGGGLQKKTKKAKKKKKQ